MFLLLFSCSVVICHMTGSLQALQPHQLSLAHPKEKKKKEKKNENMPNDSYMFAQMSI